MSFILRWDLYQFYLLFCQFSSTETNVCVSEPCQNNGTCNDYENMFNCTCAEGFNGTLCETGKVWCISEPALITSNQLDLWIDIQHGKVLLSLIVTPQLRNFVKERQALPHCTQFCNCRGKLLDKCMVCNWSLIHESSRSSFIIAWTSC